MPARLVLAFSVSMLVVSCALAAEPPVRVAPSAGSLAVRPEGAGTWKIAAEDEILPADCHLEAAIGRPAVVKMPGAALHLAPEARARLQVPQRRITLVGGRLYLNVEPGAAAWTVVCDKAQAAVAADSALEANVGPGETVVHVVRGSARVSAGEKATEVASGKTWRLAGKDASIQSLAADEQKRIETWISPPRQNQGPGQLLVEQTLGKPQRLNIARYHAHVVLQPPVALVQIDQSFFNPFPNQQEGTFVFSLPPRASVSRFAMYVTNTQLIEGELIERQRASDVYESIVRRQRDPAILEQIGTNLFRIRVFPIPKQDVKRILLDYTVPLEAVGGEHDFRLPLLSDLDPIWDFRLSGVLRGAEPKSARSLSHPAMTFENKDDGLSFSFQQNNYRPPADFSLRFAQPAAKTPTLRRYRAEPLPPPAPDPKQPPADPKAAVDPFAGKPADYFSISLPPLPASPEAAGPADVLVLADTSSHQQDLGLTRRVVRSIVGHLRPGDRVQLACVDAAIRPLHEGWLEAGSPAVEAALAALDRQFRLGAFELGACLPEAAKRFDSPRRRLVVYVGDGHEVSSPVWPESMLADLASLTTHNIALAAVLLHKPREAEWFWHSVAAAQGAALFSLFEEPIGPRDLLVWLVAGMPSPERVQAAKVDGVADDDLFYPRAILPGATVEILGRAAPRDRFHLALTLGLGKPQTHAWDLQAQPGQDDVFVGRLWGKERLDRLQHQEPFAASPDALKQQIVAMSREWNLMSPYTAFLVLESEEQYKTFAIDRAQRRRYWKPADAAPQPPLPDDWVKRVLAARDSEDQKQIDALFARTLADARAALDAGNPRRALDLLGQGPFDGPAERSPAAGAAPVAARSGGPVAVVLAISGGRPAAGRVELQPRVPRLASVCRGAAGADRCSPGRSRRLRRSAPI